MGAHTSLWRPCTVTRAKASVCALLEVPRNRGKNTTLLTSMTLLGGMGETPAVEGSTNREVFEAYVEHVLAPTTLEAGQLAIMDDLSAHKPAPG